jgi:hypothetical protein
MVLANETAGNVLLLLVVHLDSTDALMVVAVILQILRIIHVRQSLLVVLVTQDARMDFADPRRALTTV